MSCVMLAAKVLSTPSFEYNFLNFLSTSHWCQPIQLIINYCSVSSVVDLLKLTGIRIHKERRLWYIKDNSSNIFFIIVKLLAKSKLKSLPYNHTDHLPTHPPTHNFKSSLYKSIQVLHQHMRYR